MTSRTTLPTSSLAEPWEPAERLFLVVVVCVAAVVRLWAIWGAGLDHFLTGSYALSALAVYKGEMPESLFPMQHFLSPPFFFGMAGLLMVVLQSCSDKILIVLSVVMGILTIPLIHFATRRFFDRTAAIVAATLLALSDFHILYSRSALTDVTFAFWFLLAIWLYSEADAHESWGLAIVAGLATGLAWNTKYHGWLAGVVAFMALLPHLRDSPFRRFAEGVLRLVLAAAVATATYLPWLWHVTLQPGGYAALAENHSHHLHPERALHHIATHFQAQLYLDGWLGRLAPLLALAAVVYLSTGFRRPEHGVLVRWLTVFFFGGVLLGEAVFAALLAVASVGVLLSRTGVRRWTPLAFVLLFTLLTPLYMPYARLLLPWSIAVFILAGLGVSSMLAEPQRWAPGRLSTGWGLVSSVAVSALLIASVVVRPPWLDASTYRPSKGLEEAAARVAELIPPGTSTPVWGEPAVAFYLQELGTDAWPVDSPNEMTRRAAPGDTVYLVTGIYSTRIPGPEGLSGWLANHPGAAVEVGALSDARILDDFPPSDARQYVDHPGNDYDLVVYRTVVPDR